MRLTEVEQLLNEAIGLDASTIGPTATGRAMQERQRTCGIADARTYLDRVRTSAAELQALIEAVVVAESWFFRDPAAFAALARVATDRHRRLPAGRPLRLLSLPCSTGEEPWSMAITLLEAAIPAGDFHIDAVDVSRRALASARLGVYGRNSFRGTRSAARGRYFEPVPDGLRVVDRIRGLVSFKQGNLLEPASLADSAPYDVIFCRNVLIYFDSVAQDRAVGLLSRLLESDGVIFVGAAEAAVVRSRHCVAAAGGHAFTVRRAVVAPPRAPSRAPATPLGALRARNLAAPPAPLAPPRVVATGQKPAAPLVTVARTSPAEIFEEAMRLANMSRFSEAVTLCERHVQEHGPSARAFHLIGLVRDAIGDRVGAADSYRKVLYLDPQHEEALVHLALLLESDNQFEEAGRLRARARRAAQATGPTV